MFSPPPYLSLNYKHAKLNYIFYMELLLRISFLSHEFQLHYSLINKTP